MIVQVLLAAVIVFFLVKKIRRTRKEKYGTGEDPAGQVRALYRTFYKKMQKKGMPPQCTFADDSMADYLRKNCPSVPDKDISRLQTLILNASYGFREITKSDVQWLRAIFKKMKL